MVKKLFKKIFLFKYVDISKIHKWIWVRSNKDYIRFKRILVFFNIIFFILYLISASFAMFSIFLIKNGQLNINIILLLTILISIYVAILTLIIKRKGFFNHNQLAKFNFSLIKQSKESEEVREAILNLEEELRKDNKRVSKIIVIFNTYIKHFVSGIDPKRNMKLIKNFFKNCDNILDKKNETMLLKEMVLINNKIKSQNEYKYMLDYLIGITGIPSEDNLFSYLNKVDIHYHKNRFINKIFLSIDIIFEKINKHFNVIILILIILLTIFFSEKVKVILDIISNLK